MTDHGRVFVTRRNQPFVNYNQAYWSFRWACERAGVIDRGIGQTRHTFASWMLMAGEDENVGIQNAGAYNGGNGEKSIIVNLSRMVHRRAILPRLTGEVVTVSPLDDGKPQ